jgi:hypothetical protein
MDAQVFVGVIRTVISMVTNKSVVNSVVVATSEHCYRDRDLTISIDNICGTANSLICSCQHRMVGKDFPVRNKLPLYFVLAGLGRLHRAGINVSFLATLAELIT